MRLPVIATVSHKGKAFELDCERETITVRGAKGENLGTMTWSSIIEQARSIQESERIADTRNDPRYPSS
jgi:hypothetical protein